MHLLILDTCLGRLAEKAPNLKKVSTIVYAGDITLAQSRVLPLGHSIEVKGPARGADSFQPQEKPS